MPTKPSQLSGGMDPTGSIFEQDGAIFRSIVPEFTPFVKSLLQNQQIRDMIGHEFVDTAVFQEESASKNLILKHRKISPANYPYEWTGLMLHDAAQLTLDTCLKLLDEGLILKDATPWNIVFESSKPVFVDFTSIMPVDDDLNWVALDQYMHMFLFPLMAAENGFGKAARSLLLASQAGITAAEISKYMKSNALIKKSWLINRLLIPRAMVNLLQSTGQDKEVGKLISGTTIPKEKRKQFFTKLLAELNTIKPLNNRKKWAQYQADMAPYFDAERFNPKQERISLLLQELKPRTVVCIGCKKGGFAILAARQGITVTAFDTNEGSLDMLYQTAKFNDLKILPLIMDIANPTPPAGWRSSQYPAAIERLKAEGALALTQVHNLAITQGHSFIKIAEVYSDFCEKWLITEFIPIDDPRVKELLITMRRDLNWYSLENYLEALGSKFKDISTYESYPSGRTLILCKK